jgi:hypothetical protein
VLVHGFFIAFWVAQRAMNRSNETRRGFRGLRMSSKVKGQNSRTQRAGKRCEIFVA